jgi:LPXTG-motif cell wall-anchored protein
MANTYGGDVIAVCADRRHPQKDGHMKAHRALLAVAALGVAVVGPARMAVADDYPIERLTEVQGLQLVRAPEPTVRVLGVTMARTAGTTLPVTGGDVAGLTVIGLGAVGVGTVLVRRSRRTVPEA